MQLLSFKVLVSSFELQPRQRDTERRKGMNRRMSHQTKAVGLGIQNGEADNHSWNLARALREDLEVQVLRGARVRSCRDKLCSKHHGVGNLDGRACGHSVDPRPLDQALQSDDRVLPRLRRVLAGIDLLQGVPDDREHNLPARQST